MKRKLDENDIPAPVQSDGDVNATDIESARSSPVNTFQDLCLDTRLLQAVSKEGYVKPTTVQAQAIPLVLNGTDLLIHARTGSGKTAAYLLPTIESILRGKRSSKDEKRISTLILTPTRELASQVVRVIRSFTTSCAKDVRAVNLTEKTSDEVQRAWLDECPDIVVATPARALSYINSNSLQPSKLRHLILDEADLLFSYGYEDDLLAVSNAVPSEIQTIMASATLSNDVDTLKDIFSKDAVLLQLDEAPEESAISQYYVKCSEDDKFLLAFVIFKLKLVKGKCIIFVADIDRCYRLKLFFEQFGIKSCVLNSELPVNSRIHVVEEFNKNVYDIIIASDEAEVIGSENSLMQAEEQKAPEGAQTNQDVLSSKKRKVSKKSRRDKEYGVSRGIDFKNVACVLNFDLPSTSKSYTHRIGRTGRAGRSGMALSFVVPKEEQGRHKATSIATTTDDEMVLGSVIEYQKNRGQDVQDYSFDEKAVERFRYRLNDALRAVTSVAIREARIRELRQELINSDKLKRHFEENPEDLHHLRHDGELRAAKVQSHLRHVPEYLLPNGSAHVASDIGFVGFKKATGENRIRKARERNKHKGRAKVSRKNPLKSFSSKSRK